MSRNLLCNYSVIAMNIFVCWKVVSIFSIVIFHFLHRKWLRCVFFFFFFQCGIPFSTVSLYFILFSVANTNKIPIKIGQVASKREGASARYTKSNWMSKLKGIPNNNKKKTFFSNRIHLNSQSSKIPLAFIE